MSMQPEIKSKDVARRRLQNVLMTDRNGLSRADLVQIQKDIESVLGSYLEIADAQIEIAVDKDDTGTLSRKVVFSAQVGAVKRTGIRLDQVGK